MAKGGLTNYADYISLFEKGNDRDLCEAFYAEDCEFNAGPGSEIHGRENLIKFLEFMHEGVREIPRPQTVLHQGNNIFAEIDMDFHSTVTKSTILGEMKPGKTLTVKFFAVYRLNAENRIQRIDLMNWPADFGVTKEPRLGPSYGQRAAYLSYITAFNNGDLELFPLFYHPEIVVSIPGKGELKGREGVQGFYKSLFQTVRETITIHRLIADKDGMCVDITSEFTAVADAPNFHIQALKKGESVTKHSVVMYELKDGLIYRVQITRKS